MFIQVSFSLVAFDSRHAGTEQRILTLNSSNPHLALYQGAGGSHPLGKKDLPQPEALGPRKERPHGMLTSTGISQSSG